MGNSREWIAMKIKNAITAGALALLLGNANAAPVDVSYTVLGTAGNYTLDFSVTNNIAADHSLYFFGVLLPQRDIVSSPTSWDSDAHPTWSTVPYGGTTSDYNNVWMHNGFTTPSVTFGSTLSGFEVHLAELNQLVKWFAFSAGNSSYSGTGSFFVATNPGFEGIIEGSPLAGLQPISEPETNILMLTGLTVLYLSSRRRKQHATVA